MTIKKLAAYIPVTDEILALFEPPTDDEMAKYERARAEAIPKAREWVAALDGVADPVARAVLDLHNRRPGFGLECAECLNGDDHADWPCATVETVAAAVGVASAPDDILWVRGGDLQ